MSNNIVTVINIDNDNNVTNSTRNARNGDSSNSIVLLARFLCVLAYWRYSIVL